MAAFAVGRLIATQLYQVSAHNPALLARRNDMLATIALICVFAPCETRQRRLIQFTRCVSIACLISSKTCVDGHVIARVSSQ